MESTVKPKRQLKMPFHLVKRLDLGKGVYWTIKVAGFLFALLLAAVMMLGMMRPHWTAAFPAAALILLYLAFRGILKDEMLVRSLDRLR